jgi:murein DD-endopeptidase MepM/ murein hydrolase activator NlpD
MKNKLGFYVEISTVRWLVEALRDVKPPVILWHRGDRGGLQEIRRHLSPDSFIVGRWFLDIREQDAMLDSSDPAGAGRELANQILNYDFGYATEEVNGRRLVNAWMSLNECLAGPASFTAEYGNPSSEKMKLLERRAPAYDALMVAFRQQLQTKGIEAVAFNFAAGNFTHPDHYLRWFPKTLASHIYLGFHEYGWPRLQRESVSGALFYRDCMKAIREKYGDRHKVIVTEAGLTRAYGLQGPDEGWLYRNDEQRQQPLSEDEYWDSLFWYNKELLHDDYVMGACLYQVGHSGKWASFRHLTSQQDVDEGREIGLMRRIIEMKNLPDPVDGDDEKKDDEEKKKDDEEKKKDGDDFSARLVSLNQELASSLKAASDLSAQAARVQGQLAEIEASLASAATALVTVEAELARYQRIKATVFALTGQPPEIYRRTLGAGVDLDSLGRRLQDVVALTASVTALRASLAAALGQAGNAAQWQEAIVSLQARVAAFMKGVHEVEITLQEPIAVARGQRFGERPEHYRKSGLDGHEGIDYPCSPGTPVKAAADGVVFRCGDGGGAYGIRVILEHQWGAQKGYTIYAHLQALAAGLQAGQQVRTGDVLGLADSTGRNSDGTSSSTAHHLHFGLAFVSRLNQGYKVATIPDAWFCDPEPYLPKTRGRKRPRGVPDSVCVPDVVPPE